MAGGGHTLSIGVTGGIGSGKSEVCTIFAQLGMPVISADEVAKELTRSDPSLKKKIIALLGSDAYLPDGSLNRPFIAEQIFSSPSLKKKMDNIVHPVVIGEIDRRVGSLGKQGYGLVIIEAALIFESGHDERLDAVVVVDAEEDLRIKRVMERDGAKEEDVRRRMKAQWPVERKRRQADYVLLNNGTREELEEKVRFLGALFQNLHRKGKP